jgi:glycosyltransferase involved in cell wall biosynthesis
MNILFYVPQMAAYGGIERHICGLAAAVAAEGHAVRLLTTSNELGPQLRKQLNHPLINFRELPRPRFSAGPITKIIWLLNELRHSRDRKWDVIYTNAQSGLARLIWIAAGPGTRIVHHHHNAADAPEQATWSRSYRWVLRHVPRLVGCSRATCAALNAANGRDDARFLPYLTACPVKSDQITTRTPIRPLRFGFCGRLIPEKGIAAIRSLAQEPALGDIEWHIHGEGAAYPASCFAGQPRLIYHGAYHSPEDHARALLGLDAVVLFSTHNEGMPLSLMEAMSAGLPWIATDRGGTRELATSPADCLVVPADTSFSQLSGHVRALAKRILAGTTSRHRQRATYDEWMAPPVAGALWLSYFQS